MTKRMRWVGVTLLVGGVSIGGAAAARADTIGTLDWFECTDGVLTLGDPSNELECGLSGETFSRFQLVSLGIVDFLTASVEVTVGQSTSTLHFSPLPVGSFGTTLPGPPGIHTVALLLEVAPGVVTNLSLPTFIRTSVELGAPVVGNIDAEFIVPEPGSLTLLASGLVLAGMRRRRAHAFGERRHRTGPATNSRN